LFIRWLGFIEPLHARSVTKTTSIKEYQPIVTVATRRIIKIQKIRTISRQDFQQNVTPVILQAIWIGISRVLITIQFSRSLAYTPRLHAAHVTKMANTRESLAIATDAIKQTISRQRTQIM
jgi:hypothetical protein